MNEPPRVQTKSYLNDSNIVELTNEDACMSKCLRQKYNLVATSSLLHIYMLPYWNKIYDGNKHYIAI